jgi:excisionase family DNA binding protein
MKQQPIGADNTIPAGGSPARAPVWVTVKEAARISGIQRTRLYELFAQGTIKSIKIGGKRLVSFASIEALGADKHPLLSSECRK